MTWFTAPALDPEPWPTLGPEVCDFIESRLVFGPGDLLGEPATLSDELRLYIYRVYEVYPRGHALAGRRRYKRCVLSRRKGVGKTEVGGWIAIAELDPEGPVRCDGWRKEGGAWVPVGRPVHDPYIPMVAYTEEQAEDLAYGAVKAMLENCPLGNEYDVGEARIMHRSAPGELKALATAPSARDGARTTHQHIDEPHLWIEQRHHKTHRTMLNNIPKRKGADAWTHETTTMYGPGEGSVAEVAHLLAQAIAAGDVGDAQMLFDHRQAADKWDIRKRGELMDAIREASGDAWEFADPHGIASLLQDIETDGPNFRRFWLNQPATTAARMFDINRFKAMAAERTVKPKTRVALLFDGSYSRDSTGIVGATVEEIPHLFVVDAWEREITNPGWRTPRLDVDAAIALAMNTYEIVELACDPPGWHHELEEWQETYGDVVTRFETSKPSLMGPAADTFTQRLKDGKGFTHDGDRRLIRHVGNCVPINRRGYLIPTKDSNDSPHKIDLAIGAIGALSRALWHHVNSSPTEKWVITSKR